MNYLLQPLDDLVQFQQYGGGKALNLARLTQMEIPVPTWFCLSSQGLELFLSINNHIEQQIIDAVKINDPQVEEQVENLFLSGTMPQEIITAIRGHLEASKLNGKFLAVRSSGLDEDSADHSFAGQFSSFLFQKGEGQIFESIKKCWASAYSARALSYRREHGLAVTDLKVGVVIQLMVNPSVSGVGFSRNPMRPLDRETLVISSAWGLCEGVVNGDIDTDEFIVNRTDYTFEIKLGKKSERYQQREGGGVEKVATATDLINSPSLTDDQIVELSRYIKKLEDKLGTAQDCEWAYADSKLYFVQTRPITTLPAKEFFDQSINGGEYTLWDNSNIVESYSGVTSPLTFSFANYAYRQVYIQFHEIMGIDKKTIEANEKMYRNMLGLIRGRIYYNLINWYKLIFFLPGAASNNTFMETMMGVKQGLKKDIGHLFEFTKNPPKYSLYKRISVQLMILYRFIRIDKILGDFKSGFNKIYVQAMSQDFKNMSLNQLNDYYLFLQDNVLKKWQAPIINDYLCMIFFGLLKKLTESWIGQENGGLQNDLLCGEGDLESTEPTKMLMRIAKKIDCGDSAFRDFFITADNTQLLESQEVKAIFADFLYKYGFRCADELKLEEQDLHDDPSFAFQAVASYIRMKAYNIDEMEVRELEIRKGAEDKVRIALKGIKRAIYWWILKQARKAVKNREDLRFMRTKIFGVARQMFRATGHHFNQLGLIETSQDIFYLTPDEIFSFVEGRSLTDNLADIVKSRKKIFNKYKDTQDPPERFSLFGAVGLSCSYPMVLSESDLLVSERRISDNPNILLGTSCCPGVVEGIVRVAHNIKDAHGLNGEILVAARTDPGWVPLYPSCSGLLIERGSLLSHSAVVARELGLPTIVGVDGGLMDRLKTGDRVRVDASKGEIEILLRGESDV